MVQRERQMDKDVLLVVSREMVFLDYIVDLLFIGNLRD